MPLLAPPSKTVRLKNAIIVLMCLVFAGFFFKDGYQTYPARNDLAVRTLHNDETVGPDIRNFALDWLNAGGWDRATPDQRLKMDAAIKDAAPHVKGLEGWKSPFDVSLQRDLAWGLLAGLAAAIWWFIHCQLRRATADDSAVSPARGISIPWNQITRVDNTRWKTVGIVDITYTDSQGNAQTADFDDYKLQREPLLVILDMLAEKAVNAEFIPKEEPAQDAAGSADNPTPISQSPSTPAPADNPTDH